VEVTYSKGEFLIPKRSPLPLVLKGNPLLSRETPHSKG
jgi:hypothetical protein